MASIRSILSSPLGIIKLVLALCYIALGAYLYINSQLLNFIDPSYRHILAWVFMIYGAYRLVRTITDPGHE